MDFHTDMDLAKRALAGDEEALLYLRDEVIPSCRAAMLHLCNDARSRERAHEIADDLFGKAFHVDGVRVDRKNLLEAYEGRSSLKTWFRDIALKELRSWWRTPRSRKEGHLEDLAREDGTVDEFLKDDSDPAVDPEVVRMVGEALRAAVGRLDPLHSALVQLACLHGIEKQRLAKILKHDNATSGRWIKEALGTIKEGVAAEIASRDPHLQLTWPDFLGVASNQVNAARTLFSQPEEKEKQ